MNKMWAVLTSTRISLLVSTQFSSGNVSHRRSKASRLSLQQEVNMDTLQIRT